jgi:RNA polymerase sigma factor (sigma-70 family)
MPDSTPSRKFVKRLNALTDSSFEELDRRYRERLCALVERELGRRFARREDPEDAVQSALRSFYRGVREQRFHIDHSSALWKLLAQITRHKYLKHVEHHQAAKRCPEHEVQGQEDLCPTRDPTPEEAAELADILGQLADRLERDDAEILRLRLQGFSRQDISREMACTEGMVRYRLDRIRRALACVLQGEGRR